MTDTPNNKTSKDRNEISICRVLILHTRPEFGEDVEFLQVYYAREDRDKQTLREIFAKAFKQAHPQWNIKQVFVDVGHSQNTLEASFLDIGIMLPEDFPSQIT